MISRALRAVRILAWLGPAALIVLASTAHAAGPVGGKKVIRLEALKVEGKTQKPQAFFIMNRSALNFDGLELNQSFIPKIIKSVADKPF